MPGSCDGMDLARQVHARWPSILLVITSGQIKPAEAEIPDHGHFIGKPYRANELLGEVNNMLRKAWQLPRSVVFSRGRRRCDNIHILHVR